MTNLAASPFQAPATPSLHTGDSARVPKPEQRVEPRRLRRRYAIAGSAALVLLALVSWSTTRSAEAVQLEALDGSLSKVMAALERASASNDELLRWAALWHGWLEDDEAAGSGSLMEGLQHLSAAGPVEIPAETHREMLATGQYEKISEPLRRAVISFYADAERARAPIAGQAELIAALNRTLPLGSWRYVFGETGVHPQPLDFQAAVKDLHDADFNIQVRGIVHGLRERKVILDQLHARAAALWERVRLLREGS